ncbi:MAG: hypothetical protein JSS20_12775, partial [Proteobacteria bacterium]|nr:hypothetical protein [Pseudomonadota bacterium]
TIRDIWRGKTHSKLTGIERNVQKGGRPPKSLPVLVIDNTTAETGHRQRTRHSHMEAVARP